MNTGKGHFGKGFFPKLPEHLFRSRYVGTGVTQLRSRVLSEVIIVDRLLDYGLFRIDDDDGMFSVRGGLWRFVNHAECQ